MRNKEVCGSRRKFDLFAETTPELQRTSQRADNKLSLLAGFFYYGGSRNRRGEGEGQIYKKEDGNSL